MEVAHEHGTDAGACLACPLCALLRAVAASRPEVERHLVAAGRELTLAVLALLAAHQRAVVPDGDGAGPSRPPRPGRTGGLQRITVE